MSRSASRRANVVVISGGVQGIGRALANRYAARGASIGILDVLPLHDAEALLELGAAGVDSRVIDVRDAATTREAVSELCGSLGDPDFVITSAGVAEARLVDNTPDASFERVMDINVVGTRNVVTAALPFMRPGTGFALVASMAGIVPNFGYTSYGTSKFAVMGFGHCLRMELQPRQISVHLICPPEVDTQLLIDERAASHPLTLELKRTVGRLDLESGADAILSGLDRGRMVVTPNLRSAMVRRIVGVFPDTSARVSGALVRRWYRRENRG